jgi:hypothetical protein
MPQRVARVDDELLDPGNVRLARDHRLNRRNAADADLTDEFPVEAGAHDAFAYELDI